MKETIAERTGCMYKKSIISSSVRDDQYISAVRDLHGIPNGIENHINVTFLKIDFLEAQNSSLPRDINAVYDLIHP